jgi:hypothetical protein
LDAAALQTQAARYLIQAGDNKEGKELLKKAAKLNEMEENFIGAVCLYLELKDMKELKRVAPNAANQIGRESDFGRALDKFAKVEEGSEEEKGAKQELAINAKRFMEAMGCIIAQGLLRVSSK